MGTAVLGYYAASSGNFLPTFRDNLSVPYGLDIQTNRQWQNIGSTTTMLLNSKTRLYGTTFQGGGGVGAPRQEYEQGEWPNFERVMETSPSPP